jgi:hypothetical protein
MSRQRIILPTPVGQTLKMIACPLVFQSTAEAACDEDWLFLDITRNGDVSKLHARNTNDYPITYSIRVGTNDGREQ